MPAASAARQDPAPGPRRREDDGLPRHLVPSGFRSPGEHLDRDTLDPRMLRHRQQTDQARIGRVLDERLGGSGLGIASADDPAERLVTRQQLARKPLAGGLVALFLLEQGSRRASSAQNRAADPPEVP